MHDGDLHVGTCRVSRWPVVRRRRRRSRRRRRDLSLARHVQRRCQQRRCDRCRVTRPTRTSSWSPATPTIATHGVADITLGAGDADGHGDGDRSREPVGRVRRSSSGSTARMTRRAPARRSSRRHRTFRSRGGAATSPPFTPTAVGHLSLARHYSGDTNNAGVTGACNAANENVVVAPATPTIATQASPNITLGAGSLTDTATVTGRVEPVAAGATIDVPALWPGRCDVRDGDLHVGTGHLSGGRWPGRRRRRLRRRPIGHLSLARHLQRRRQQRPGLRCVQRGQRERRRRPGDADDRHDGVAGHHARRRVTDTTRPP